MIIPLFYAKIGILTAADRKAGILGYFLSSFSAFPGPK
jgi:hypothetical protein